MNSTADLLTAGRYQHLKQDKQIDDASIENIVGNVTTKTSIELPAEIKKLITGSDYWINAKSNRYRKLIREGHLDKLLHLAAEARTKDSPANWFAKVCSKAAWDRTLAYFAKLSEVAHKAELVARRLGTRVSKFIYKQIWNGVNVERWAIQAEEMRHDKAGQGRLQHFAWLCLHEQEILART